MSAALDWDNAQVSRQACCHREFHDTGGGQVGDIDELKVAEHFKLPASRLCSLPYRDLSDEVHALPSAWAALASQATMLETSASQSALLEAGSSAAL